MVASFVSGSEHEERIWTEFSGNHRIAARFVELEWPTVVLVAIEKPYEGTKKEPGREERFIRVHFERLSSEDQRYIAIATLPDPIDAQPVKLDLIGREQRITLPVPSLPPPWDYEVGIVAIRVKGEAVEISRDDDSPGERSDAVFMSRKASLTEPGHFHAPLRVKGDTSVLLRALYRVKRFDDSLLLTIQPTVSVDNKFVPFAAQPLVKEAAGIQKGLAASRTRLAGARRDLQTLPSEIGRTRSQFVPANAPGSQFINGQISQRLRQLESGLQRAQRNVRSLNSSIPRDTSRLAVLKSVHDLVQVYSGEIEIDFVVRRQFNEVNQLMLAANPNGTVDLTSSADPARESD